MIKILRIGGLLTIPRCTFQRRGVAETCGAVLSRQPQTFASIDCSIYPNVWVSSYGRRSFTFWSL